MTTRKKRVKKDDLARGEREKEIDRVAGKGEGRGQMGQ